MPTTVPITDPAKVITAFVKSRQLRFRERAINYLRRVPVLCNVRVCHVVNSNIPDLNAGWVNFYWRMMQTLIVFFGATHGFNGLRGVAEDHLNSKGRVILRWVVGIIWLAVLAIAFITIFTS